MHSKIRELPIDGSALKFPAKAFLTIVFIALLIITMVIRCFDIGYKMSATFSPLVDAAMEIKLQGTTAHLWFEEIISGDPTVPLAEVMQHIDNAIRYATAMLEGGPNPRGNIVPQVDPGLRQDVEAILSELNTFRSITARRYDSKETAGVGTPLDQEYDAVFAAFRKQADLVTLKLQQTIATELASFRRLQITLVVTLIVLTGIMLLVIYRYERQRAKNLETIRRAYDQVKILSGMLPICAACKKIRDDRGYWKRIEAYITEHSEAEFSHGICPECAHKLYPDIFPRFSN